MSWEVLKESSFLYAILSVTKKNVLRLNVRLAQFCELLNNHTSYLENLVKFRYYKCVKSIFVDRFKLCIVFLHCVEHGYTVCMINRKIEGSGHIREKQQFEKFHFYAFFYAVLFITSNFIKSESI